MEGQRSVKRLLHLKLERRNRNHSIGWAHVTVLILTFFVISLFGQDDPGQLMPEPPPYVIQPNDVLEIFVWNESDLSRQVRVRPDGRISFPLVQDLKAVGLTPEELKLAAEERLSEYLESPNVTVIVESIEHYSIFVTGLVNSPGEFTSENSLTVLQALSLAGGFQEYADKSNVRVFRTYGKENVIFEFDYDDVIKGKKTHQNIVLRSGDVVVVP